MLLPFGLQSSRRQSLWIEHLARLERGCKQPGWHSSAGIARQNALSSSFMYSVLTCQSPRDADLPGGRTCSGVSSNGTGGGAIFDGNSVPFYPQSSGKLLARDSMVGGWICGTGCRPTRRAQHPTFHARVNRPATRLQSSLLSRTRDRRIRQSAPLLPG